MVLIREILISGALLRTSCLYSEFNLERAFPDFLMPFGSLSDLVEMGEARETTLLEIEAARVKRALVDCSKTEVEA